MFREDGIMAQTMARTIYEDYREAVISGALQPGNMLGEQQVADRYGASKMPVREALHQLCQEGYLVSYPRRGYVVSNITEEDFREIQQVRLPLELLAAELAICQASEEELRGLYEIISQGTGPEHTLGQVHASNSSFHLELARLSGNKRLYASLEHLIGQVRRAGYRFYSQAALEERHYHRDIADALLARDVERAKALLRRDLELTY